VRIPKFSSWTTKPAFASPSPPSFATSATPSKPSNPPNSPSSASPLAPSKSFSSTSGSPEWTAWKPQPHSEPPQPPSVIIISGHGTIETAVRATKLGAFDFIEKPLSLERIIVLVRNAIEQRRLQEENQLLHTELGHRYRIVGESVPMKALRQQIAVTAPTNGRVLISAKAAPEKNSSRARCTPPASATRPSSSK